VATRDSHLIVHNHLFAFLSLVCKRGLIVGVRTTTTTTTAATTLTISAFAACIPTTTTTTAAAATATAGLLYVIGH
jgi:hypothetical protein